MLLSLFLVYSVLLSREVGFQLQKHSSTGRDFRLALRHLLVCLTTFNPALNNTNSGISVSNSHQ